MKKIYLSLFLLNLIHLSFAQTSFQAVFGTELNDELRCVFPSTDGNYFIIGDARYSLTIGSTSLLIKIDQQGNKLWSKHIRINEDIEIHKGLVLPNGTICLVGKVFPAGGGGYNGIILKLDAQGNLLWSKYIGTYQNEFFNDIVAGSHGSLIVSGISFNTSQGLGYGDFLLVKIDSLGNTKWSSAMGGLSGDLGYCLDICRDRGFIMGGFTRSYNAQGGRAYLLKTDSLGNPAWGTIVGGTLGAVFFTAKQAKDGTFYAAGSTEDYGSGLKDILLVKFDSIGQVLWSKTYGNTGDDEAKDLIIDKDGSILLTGYTRQGGLIKALLLKTNGNGDLIWSNSYGKNDPSYGSSLASHPDKGWILAGTTQESFPSGSSTRSKSFYVVKTDSLGNSGCFQHVPNLTMTTPQATVLNGISNLNYLADSGNFANIFVQNYNFETTYCLDTSISVNINQPKITESLPSIFPNPYSNSFNIQFTEDPSALVQLRIVNTMGQTVYETSLVNKFEIISTPNLATGMYLGIFTQKNRVIGQIKLFKNP